MSIGTTSNMEWLVGNGGGGSVEYTAGHGIDIDNVDHIISVDQSEIQDKLTAGENITIQNNVISANPQRQSDWNQSDSDAVDYIRNKPQNLVQDASYVHTDNNFTTADKNKLDGIESGAQANVQSDWNVSDSSSDAFIKNKPTIPSGDQLVPSATSSDEGKILTVDSNGDPSWAPAQTYSQVQSNWNETDSSAVSYIQNKPSIPTATSDLTNDSNFITASDVPGAQVQSDWTEADTSSAAYIAHKPSIPTKTSDLTNDTGYITSASLPSQSQLVPEYTLPEDNGKVLTAGSTTYWTTIPSQVQSDWTESDSSDPAYIANKPTIPTVDQSYSASSTNAQSGTAVAQAVSGVDAVPDVTSSDNGKVLVATYSGGTGSYAWASAPPANAIILTSSSTWSDFHTPYSAGRKDIYYKHTSPYSPFESRAELYLHLTAVSDVDGTSTNFTFALFEAAWESGGVDYTIRCKFRYSGNPMVHVNALVVEQSYSATSTRAQSGVAVAQAISAVKQVPASTSADEAKVLTVDSNGDTFWNTPAQFTQQQSDWTQTNNQSVDYIKHKPGAKPVLAGPGIQITETSNDITISTTTLSGISEIKYVQSLPASPVAGVLYLIPQT